METTFTVMLTRIIEVPTRLEGMETSERFSKICRNFKVPTRLEGMETYDDVFTRPTVGWFRPDLRGWKLTMMCSPAPPSVGSDPT